MRILFYMTLFISLLFTTGCVFIEDDQDFVDEKSWTQPERDIQPGIGI